MVAVPDLLMRLKCRCGPVLIPELPLQPMSCPIANARRRPRGDAVADLAQVHIHRVGAVIVANANAGAAQAVIDTPLDSLRVGPAGGNVGRRIAVTGIARGEVDEAASGCIDGSADRHDEIDGRRRVRRAACRSPGGADTKRPTKRDDATRRRGSNSEGRARRRRRRGTRRAEDERSRRQCDDCECTRSDHASLLPTFENAARRGVRHCSCRPKATQSSVRERRRAGTCDPSHDGRTRTDAADRPHSRHQRSVVRRAR